MGDIKFLPLSVSFSGLRSAGVSQIEMSHTNRVAARNEKLRYTSDFDGATRFQERAVTHTLAYQPARFPAVAIQ